MESGPCPRKLEDGEYDHLGGGISDPEGAAQELETRLRIPHGSVKASIVRRSIGLPKDEEITIDRVRQFLQRTNKTEIAALILLQRACGHYQVGT